MLLTGGYLYLVDHFWCLFAAADSGFLEIQNLFAADSVFLEIIFVGSHTYLLVDGGAAFFGIIINLTYFA